MGMLWGLSGNAFSPAVEESRWLQTWRFWVPFFDRFLTPFWPSFLASFWRSLGEPVFIYRWFLDVQTGLQMDVRFGSEIFPLGSFFLTFSMCFCTFFPNLVIFLGWPFWVCLQAALFKHWRCLRNPGASFWQPFFERFSSMFLRSRMVLKSGWKQEAANLDQNVIGWFQGVHFWTLLFQDFRHPKSWNNLEIILK